MKASDICSMKSSGHPCRFLANACNWRLKAGGSGTNKVIHLSAGPGLEQETKKRYPLPAKPGSIYPVPVVPTSPLYKNEGVQVRYLDYRSDELFLVGNSCVGT